MKKFILLCLVLAQYLFSYCQNDSLSKTRWVVGLGFPDLLHGGIRYDLTRHSQIGFSAGFLPNYDQMVGAGTIEHRLYFGAINTHRTNWFFRQSFTFLTDRDGGMLGFSAGTDLRTKSGRSGWTFDAGIDFPIPKDSDDRNFYGVLRIQYYKYFKKH